MMQRQPLLLNVNQSNKLRQALDDAILADRANQVHLPRSISQLSLAAHSQKSPMSVQEEMKYHIEDHEDTLKMLSMNHQMLSGRDHESERSLSVLQQSMMSSKTGDICIVC